MEATFYWWAGCMALSALAAAVLIALLAVYWRNMRKAPSPFAKGLVAFAGLFALEALGSIGVWTSLSGEYGADVAIPMMVMRALEVVGAGVLLYVSWE
ncbi:MAG: hypothetical protein QOE90_2578 [Thermoplasmata archaeon]|jgi:phosphoglycerol transferase MdoB-like AlkP superfamily enzyme|nr:hypothetical protein [Thermoplasmata archaeon]